MSPETRFTLPTDKKLILCCRKCTRTGTFHAANLEAAIQQAIAQGWIHDAWPPDREQYVCPRCPSSIRDDRARAAKLAAAIGLK